MKPGTKLAAWTAGVLVALTVAHYRPWQGTSVAAAGELSVGFLPVTCHLTCPVTDFASKTTTTGQHIASQRFTSARGRAAAPSVAGGGRPAGSAAGGEAPRVAGGVMTDIHRPAGAHRSRHRPRASTRNGVRAGSWKTTLAASQASTTT